MPKVINTTMKSIRDYINLIENAQRVNEFAPDDSGDSREYEYEVYQANLKDQFDWIGGPLYKSDNLGKAHSIAYELWKKHPDKMFMIWQERSQGSRGGYGPKGSELESNDEEQLEETSPEAIAKIAQITRK